MRAAALQVQFPERRNATRKQLRGKTLWNYVVTVGLALQRIALVATYRRTSRMAGPNKADDVGYRGRRLASARISQVSRGYQT